MTSPGRDLRLALRALRARPALSIVRVTTLAVVVAAASAVLLVVNATLVRPLPFKAPDRLVRIYMQPPGTSSFDQANPLHPLVFVRVRASVLTALEGVEGIWARERAVAGDGEPESLPAAAVSAGLFDLVGAEPLVGRTFTSDEARDARRVVVLSHGFWTRRYGEDRSAVGRTLIIDREPHEVIGVMRPGFQPPFVASEFWTPLEVRDGNLINPSATFIQTIGRLRTFDSRDTAAGMPVAVVSQSFAQRFWPGEDVMGKRLRRNGVNAPWLTIIGIVGDVHDVGYGQAPDAILYIPYAQNNVATSPIGLVVRTEADPLSYGAAIKAAIWAVDPAQPVSSISTLDVFLSDSLGAQRFRSVLLGLFGCVGLLLAAVGVYAVTARSVAERTREVGVRIALGGQPLRVWWAVARRTLGAFAAGLGVGCAGAAAAASILAWIFPEVQAASPLAAAPAFVLLVLAGGGTTLAAAFRATRVDPIRALR